MIKRATHDDWAQFEALALKLHALSVFKETPVSGDALFKQYLATVTFNGPPLWLAWKGKKIVGFLWGSMTKFWWSEFYYATDLAFYCEDPASARGLIRSFEIWAWSQPLVKHVVLGVSSGHAKIERVGRLYELLGYRRIGGMFEKEKGP